MTENQNKTSDPNPSPIQNSDPTFASKIINSIDLNSWQTKTAFISLGFASIFGGISYGMRLAAQKDPKAYQEAFKHEPVHKFARRAFYKGTAYAFFGTGVLFSGIWLAMGMPTLKEFAKSMQETLPNPKKSNLEEWQIGWFRQKKLVDDQKQVSEYPQWLQSAVKKDEKQ